MVNFLLLETKNQKQNLNNHSLLSTSMSSTSPDTTTAKRSSGPGSPVVHSVRSSSLRNYPSARSKSLSPRKRNANQPLHIRMNLTETQMDKITDA